MSLKTATLFALVGTSAHLLWMLAMSLPRLWASGAPLIHRVGILPSVLFHVTLIMFFATLLQKQYGSEPAE